MGNFFSRSKSNDSFNAIKNNHINKFVSRDNISNYNDIDARGGGNSKNKTKKKKTKSKLNNTKRSKILYK